MSNRRSKIVIKLTQQETEAVTKFASDAKLPLELLAKQCIFYAMQQAYTVVTQSNSQGDTNAEAPAPVTDSTTEAVPLSQSIDSSILANQETVTASSIQDTRDGHRP